MTSGDWDRWAAFARALVDRLAFAAESLAVALLVLAFLGLAVARFDLTGAAYVWGFFWMRLAECEEAVRRPALAVLGGIVALATALIGCLRWPKAARAFDPFPCSRGARRKMLERLG